MADDNIDNLINELSRLCIHRVRSTTALQRVIEETGRQEEELIRRIRLARTTPAGREAPPPADNPFSIGDSARITNRLRNEYGTTGVVTHVGTRMVTIRGTNRRTYSRAWWNLELRNGDHAQ